MGRMIKSEKHKTSSFLPTSESARVTKTADDHLIGQDQFIVA